jgi:hypothetical protein
MRTPSPISSRPYEVAVFGSGSLPHGRCFRICVARQKIICRGPVQEVIFGPLGDDPICPVAALHDFLASRPFTPSSRPLFANARDSPNHPESVQFHGSKSASPLRFRRYHALLNEIFLGRILEYPRDNKNPWNRWDTL